VKVYPIFADNGDVCMREVTEEDYREFIKKHKEVIFKDRIGKREVRIPIGKKWNIPEKKLQPRNFVMEGTTFWSFPKRGDWATHKGNYRGNWPPQMARNIILRYSKPGDLVLDQMCGSGTTLVECKLLGRNAIGVDINLNAIMLTRDRLNFNYLPIDMNFPKTTQKTYVGDARELDLIDSESIDLIATHPPYANIISYSKRKVSGDLSNVYSVDEYILAMREIAKESFRVLKPDRYCAILVGDTRRNKHYVPIAFRVMQAFLEEGFILKEDVIKHQWRCKATPFWLKKSVEHNFLLIMHEHLFIFRKPKKGEDTKHFADSMAWWKIKPSAS